ncbi:MAG: hypothetical protein OXG51_12805, partial [Gammaproteobacteria bacterium]|nr:hypothetical protein [Gammaproteobacteria bacterium]
MELTVAIVSILIAGISLYVSRDALESAKQAQTSDFQVSQRVKEDLAKLVAVLDSIMMKGAVYSQQPRETRDSPDFRNRVRLTHEFDALHDILHGGTALALRTFVAEKSKAASAEGRQEESWRLFFLYLAEMPHSETPYEAALNAARLENLLSQLSERDIQELSSYLMDIPSRIEQLWDDRKHDVVLTVMMDLENPSEVGSPSICKEPDSEMGLLQEEFAAFARYLKEDVRIDDPDLDVFWSVFKSNVQELENALDRGGNPNVTDNEIVRRYREHLDG